MSSIAMPRIPEKYTRVAVVLHWLIATLIVANVLLIWTLDAMSDATADVWGRSIIDTHKSIGITVLGLAIMRLLWRATHRPPPLPAVYPSWEKKLSHAAHWALYLVMFVLPLSGWLHDSAWKDAASHPMRWFGLFEWPRIAAIMNTEAAAKERLHELFGELHELFGYLLYVLYVLHVAGALKHQFRDKVPEIQRMLP